MVFRVVSLLLILCAVGCKSRPLGPYATPRVIGQVLAADTGQPLADVAVTRDWRERLSRDPWPPKGGEQLMRKPPIRTDATGRFELASERVLSVVRGSGWDVVGLAFDRPGYLRFQTNCPIALATNFADGETVLDAGRILLQPARR